MIGTATWPALAQTAPNTGQLAVRSDGFIFWIQDGQRHVVYPATMADPRIDSLTEGIPLDASLQPSPPGPAVGPGGGPGGQLVVRSDGVVFWIQGSQRHAVYPAAMADAQINALPESVPLNASLQTNAPGRVAGLPSGNSRGDRLLPGQACQCFLVRGTGQRSDLAIRLVSFERAAWARLQASHPSNQPPKEGFEYAIAVVNIKYTNGPRDLPLSIDRFDFFILDANDTLYVPAFVIEPEQLSSTTAYPGSEVTGAIAYQVPRGDADLVLVWRYNDDVATWFGVP